MKFSAAVVKHTAAADGDGVFSQKYAAGIFSCVRWPRVNWTIYLPCGPFKSCANQTFIVILLDIF